MSEKQIVVVLEDESHIEKPVSRDLRHQALSLVKETLEDAQSTSQLPDTLLDLLTQIIKPLFSGEQHSKLTSTGRKNRVQHGLPASANRFSSQILFDDVDSRPLWKNGWTGPLLLHVLRNYSRIPDASVQRKTLEAHFHLLVPPILRQIDDVEISHKCYGCRCLKLLCDNLYDTQSDVLKRSGLTDVFIDALKNDFSLLPTLTPEDESLMLLQDLYPAYLSLMRARFLRLSDNQHRSSSSSASGVSSLDAKPNHATTTSNTAKREAPSTTATTTETEHALRNTHLTTLLRHQLLHSLHHLSTSTGEGSTISTPLSTFLIAQLPTLFTALGSASTAHLAAVLPLLRHVLLDPFGTAAPALLLATARSLQGVVAVTWPRIRSRWWGEVLRGAVGCWLNVCDDEIMEGEEGEHLKQRTTTATTRAATLVEVKSELRVLVWLLEDVVGQPRFAAVRADLVAEEPLLQGLFRGDGEGGMEMESKVVECTKTTTMTKKNKKQGIIEEL